MSAENVRRTESFLLMRADVSESCGLAPVMMINDEVYGRLTVDDLDDIFSEV